MDTTRTLPSGTVTFLFTDIEGSTKLWEQYPEAMRVALARHNAILRRTIEAHSGSVFKTVGDAFCAAFTTAPEALEGALDGQRALLAEPWSGISALRVRMALHTGAAQEQDGDYFGLPLNRVARLLDAAHGEQILLSQATADLVRDLLGEAVSLRDLGAHHLKDLQQREHFFQLLHPDLPGEFPPLRSLEAFAHNLPRQLTSFIGRTREMAEVKQLLTETRLLTLTGTGGCGKTRLALQVAADLLDAFSDGVWLVELAPLSDPALVPQAVASVVGVREEPGTLLTQTLINVLRHKSLLLVLDNCEHLLDACASLADALLRSCPSVQLLATSREGLNIGGETPFSLRPLSVPDPQHLPALPESLMQYETVHLFVDRATTVAPTFKLTPQNAPAVARVCQRLDGIPLALELAAARVKALTVEKLAERLDDCFRLLTGGSRTALPRQQTLRALIDWSYDLLSEEERALLRRLSAFAGGWTLQAAEAVGAGEGLEEWEVLDRLTSLVEKSLVVYEEQHGEERYRLLETVRQYARDRLMEAGETEAVRGRHLDFFLRLAEEAGPKWHGPEQGAWVERLEREHDNLRVAQEWSLAGEVGAEASLRLAFALWHFWSARNYYGAPREWLSGVVEKSAGVTLREDRTLTVLRARVLDVAGEMARSLGDYASARSLFEESLVASREVGDKESIAVALCHLGSAVSFQRDYSLARSLLEEGAAMLREAGHRAELAWALFNLGWMSWRQGDGVAACSHFEESLRIFRELGIEMGIAWTLSHLGRASWVQGDYPAAHSLLTESLALFRELSHKSGMTFSLESLAGVTLDQGDEATACSLLAESLSVRRELENKWGLNWVLGRFARLAADRGQVERAARLFAAAEASGEAGDKSLLPSKRAEDERRVAVTRTALGEKAFAAAWAEGRAMTHEQAVAYALEEPGAGTRAQ